MIAALFVEPKGCYSGLDGIDLWDEARDARLYDGPYSVVAHPPCSRWCQLASVNRAYGVGLPELRWGKSVARATVSFLKNHGGGDLPRLSKKEAKATPPEFRDVLIAMARWKESAVILPLDAQEASEH